MAVDPIIIERTLDASVEKVWNALTDKEQMKQWYFQLEEFRPQAGFKFQFEGGTEERSYLHLCEVNEVIDLRKLKHSWRYDGYQGNSFVSWELTPEGDKTQLKLSHEGLETFPQTNPDFAKNNFVAGWTEIVSLNLPAFLAKN